jgi:hypothetical protein
MRTHVFFLFRRVLTLQFSNAKFSLTSSPGRLRSGVTGVKDGKLSLFQFLEKTFPKIRDLGSPKLQPQVPLCILRSWRANENL